MLCSDGSLPHIDQEERTVRICNPFLSYTCPDKYICDYNIHIARYQCCEKVERVGHRQAKGHPVVQKIRDHDQQGFDPVPVVAECLPSAGGDIPIGPHPVAPPRRQQNREQLALAARKVAPDFTHPLADIPAVGPEGLDDRTPHFGRFVVEQTDQNVEIRSPQGWGTMTDFE